MSLLITCSCGHSVDGHDALGCHHEFGTPRACGCPFDRALAIDALVDAERVAAQRRYAGLTAPRG